MTPHLFLYVLKNLPARYKTESKHQLIFPNCKHVLKKQEARCAFYLNKSTLTGILVPYISTIIFFIIFYYLFYMLNFSNKQSSLAYRVYKGS